MGGSAGVPAYSPIGSSPFSINHSKVTRLDCVRSEDIRNRLKQEAVVAQGEEEERRMERQSDREPRQLNRESDERASRGKETQRETEEKME